MGLILVNPRTFLPLLLFIGFIYTLMGISASEISAFTGADLPNLFAIGAAIIVIAVVLYVVSMTGSIARR